MQRKPTHHRPPARPSRDIAVALAAKTVALALLYALFFGPARQVVVDAASVAAHLEGAPGSGAAERMKP